MIGYIILGVAVILVFTAISAYNTLVKLRNNRENAFADIDVNTRITARPKII